MRMIIASPNIKNEAGGFDATRYSAQVSQRNSYNLNAGVMLRGGENMGIKFVMEKKLSKL